MRILCECGRTADDFLAKLREAGWVQPVARRDDWLCPDCVTRTAVIKRRKTSGVVLTSAALMARCPELRARRAGT
jgi:hypothetical protein